VHDVVPFVTEAVKPVGQTQVDGVVDDGMRPMGHWLYPQTYYPVEFNIGTMVPVHNTGIQY
jgi:hypothetical protein